MHRVGTSKNNVSVFIDLAAMRLHPYILVVQRNLARSQKLPFIDALNELDPNHVLGNLAL